MAIFICTGLYNEADSFQKGRTGFRDGVGEQGMPLPSLVLMQSPTERGRPYWMVPAASRCSSFSLLNHRGISSEQRGEEIGKGNKKQTYRWKNHEARKRRGREGDRTKGITLWRSLPDEVAKTKKEGGFLARVGRRMHEMWGPGERPGVGIGWPGAVPTGLW